MSKKAYPLQIPHGLLELAERKGKEDRTDKATALRQWLYTGAEAYVLELLSEGRMTLSQAAELLDLSVYEVQRLAQEQGIEVGATEEQYERARGTARKLGRTLRTPKSVQR